MPPESAQSIDESERRDGSRHPIELKVEYKRLNTFFADFTKNISKGGTFIRTQKPLDVGTEFVFALTVPKLREPVRLCGRVIWVIPPDKATDETPAGMGIHFQYADEAERASIDAIVVELMHEQLGEHLTTKLLGRKQR